MTNVTRPNPGGLELEGATELVRHIVAETHGLEYPLLWRGARAIQKLFARCKDEEQRRIRFQELFRDFWTFRAEDLVESNTVEEFAARLANCLDPAVQLRFRTYVALSEAFNYVMHTGLFGREWLDPYFQWWGFLPAPTYETDVLFVDICAQIGRLVPQEMYELMLEDSHVPVLTTLLSVADGFTRFSTQWPLTLNSSDATDMLRYLESVQRHPTVSTQVLDFALRAQVYIACGVALWTRRWTGYRFQ